MANGNKNKSIYFSMSVAVKIYALDISINGCHSIV